MTAVKYVHFTIEHVYDLSPQHQSKFLIPIFRVLLSYTVRNVLLFCCFRAGKVWLVTSRLGAEKPLTFFYSVWHPPMKQYLGTASELIVTHSGCAPWACSLQQSVLGSPEQKRTSKTLLKRTVIRRRLFCFLLEWWDNTARMSTFLSSPVVSLHSMWQLHCKNKIPKFRNKYSQKRNIGVTVPISTFMPLWAIYIFPRSVSLFCWRKYVDRSWDYSI